MKGGADLERAKGLVRYDLSPEFIELLLTDLLGVSIGSMAGLELEWGSIIWPWAAGGGKECDPPMVRGVWLNCGSFKDAGDSW